MRITKKRFLSFVLLSFFSLVLIMLSSPNLVSAQVTSGGGLIDSQEGLNDVGVVFGDKGNGPQDIRYIIARIITIVLGFLGIIFFALIIFAGFQYMTSAGNEEQTKKALSLLRNALIGLIIILVSWGISRYILSTLTRAINNSVDYRNYRSYP